MLWQTNTPPANPHRQRAGSEEPQKRFADALGFCSVHLCQPHAKQDVEHLPVLLDRVVGQFGQLVIPEKKMNTIAMAEFQAGNVLHDGVRHAPAILRVRGTAVAGLLHYQMSPGKSVQCGNSSDQVEIPTVPMQITGHHYLITGLGSNVDHVAHPAGGREVCIGRLAKQSNRVFRILGRCNHDPMSLAQTGQLRDRRFLNHLFCVLS